MKKIDVIVILGGGTDGTLIPMLYTKERLDACMKLGKIIFTTPIVVSGGYSIFIEKPKYTEADVMHHYLVEHGIPSKHIYKESKSRDTITNAYFTKQIIKKHLQWKRVLIITTDGHIARSRWIFKKVFGDQYQFSFLGVPSNSASFAQKHPGRQRYERYLINLYRILFISAKRGDDGKIIAIWKKVSAQFSNNTQAKAFGEKIRKAKKRHLGYESPHK